MMQTISILPFVLYTILISNEVVSISNEAYRSNNDPLIFAHVIYRHGNRNIIKPYANDPFGNEDKWPGGFGALTRVGMQQQYDLGKYLRKRYTKVINGTYSSNQVYFRSTDMERTLMSAQCNAAGLFPPSLGQMWNVLLRWQPIPIHTIPIDDDILIALGECPRRTYLHEPLMDSEMQAIYEKHEPFIKLLEKNTGETIKHLIDVMLIYDTLHIENLKGLSLAPWTKEALANNTLRKLASKWYETFTHTTEMKKLMSGHLLKEMLDRFKNKTLSLLRPDRSLWIYSAHDLTIANILNTIGVFDMDIPPFASSVHFELYRNEMDHYVQIYYRKTNEETLTPLNIPHCGTKCPLDRFYELYKKILPTESEEYSKLCAMI